MFLERFEISARSGMGGRFSPQKRERLPEADSAHAGNVPVFDNRES